LESSPWTEPAENTPEELKRYSMVSQTEFLRDYHLGVATEFHRDGHAAQWASSTSHRFWGNEDACIEVDTSGVPETGRSRCAMAVSSDSRLLAIAGSSIIRILELKTQKLLSELSGHPDNVDRLLFAPCKSANGKDCPTEEYTLLSTSKDDRERGRVIVVWSIDSNGCQVAQVPFIPFGTEHLTESAMSAIADKLEQEHDVTANEIGSIRSSLSTAIDAIERQHRLKVLQSASGALPHYNSSDLFSSSEDELRVLYLAKNETTQHGMRPADELPQVIIANIHPPTSSAGEENQSNRNYFETSKVLQGHTDMILSVAFSADGKLVASASWDQTFRIWLAETGECLHIIGPSGNQNWTAAFSPSGDQVLFSGGGGRDRPSPLALYNTVTGEEVSRLCHPELESWLRHSAFHPNGKSAAVVNNISVLLWDFSQANSNPDNETPPSNAIEILKLAMPDEEAAKSRVRMMRIFAGCLDVAWVDGGKKLLVRSNDNTIFVWDRERNVKWRLQRPDETELPGAGSDFAYVDDGECGMVVALNGDRKVRFWKL
jgi:WD40 repeat protein